MADLIVRGIAPVGELVDAIMVAARVLDTWECWAHDGKYHFALYGGWTIAISADSADRICVETCWQTRPETKMWTLTHRLDRLAGVVRRMSTMPAAA
jgi:hypothetical protein